MKLAILGTRGIPARYGGFETFADELATRLVELGVDVTVYCEKSSTAQADSYRGVKLIYIPVVKIGPLATILFDLRCLWKARKNFDVVYMLGYGASVFCFIPRLWGTKVWINMDGIEWARAKWSRVAKTYFKIMESLAMRAVDLVIADAEGIKDHLEKRHSNMPSCRVIPYGAHIIDNAPSGSILKEWDLQMCGYFIIICRLEPENNIKEIIEGYLASATRKQLIVVGNKDIDTDYVNDLVKYESDRVRFIGTVYDKEKISALRYHAAAYLHGHMVGGTNPSLLESLACGNVIIAHDNVFNREVARSAAQYFSDAKKDMPVILKRLESLSEADRKLRSVAAKERIRQRYTWERIAKDYMELLKPQP